MHFLCGKWERKNQIISNELCIYLYESEEKGIMTAIGSLPGVCESSSMKY